MKSNARDGERGSSCRSGETQGGQLIRDVAITRLFSIEVPVYYLLYFLSRLVS